MHPQPLYTPSFVCMLASFKHVACLCLLQRWYQLTPLINASGGVVLSFSLFCAQSWQHTQAHTPLSTMCC